MNYTQLYKQATMNKVASEEQIYKVAKLLKKATMNKVASDKQTYNGTIPWKSEDFQMTVLFPEAKFGSPARHIGMKINDRSNIKAINKYVNNLEVPANIRKTFDPNKSQRVQEADWKNRQKQMFYDKYKKSLYTPNF